MRALSSRDWMGLQEVALELHSAAALPDLASRILAGMQRLFPFDGGSVQDDRGGIRNIPWLSGDTIVWQATAPPAETIARGLRMMAPWGPDFLPFREAFFEVSAERHPHTAYFRRTGDGTAQRLSDLVPAKELRRSRFFNEISRPQGLTSQLTTFIPLSPSSLLIIAAARRRIDFSPRECALLNLMRPHVAMAWRQAMRRESDKQRSPKLSRKGPTPSARGPSYHVLTPREDEILHWLAQGKRNSEIAMICGLATTTVETHLKNIFVKLGVETRTAAAAMAWEKLLRPGAN